jgi:predicted nucleic acid-binding protein
MSVSIIFDTSVWIEYFKGNDAYFDTCRQFIEKGTVKTIELIFAELLQGARNKKEVETIKAYYQLIPKPEIVHLYLLAGEYSQKEKLTGKGIGLIDACIITATIASNSRLWTLDKKIKTFLNEKYLYKF